MNSSAISRSSPVYVRATSSSVTGLCCSSGTEALFRFLFLVPQRPFWAMLWFCMCCAPSCKDQFHSVWKRTLHIKMTTTTTTHVHYIQDTEKIHVYIWKKLIINKLILL
jgi:hypothetical protein